MYKPDLALYNLQCLRCHKTRQNETSIHLSILVCSYVCMYVCMYVCIYLSITLKSNEKFICYRKIMHFINLNVAMIFYKQ